MLTDSRFWLGFVAGAVVVYFVVPMVRGQMAAQRGNGGR